MLEDRPKNSKDKDEGNRLAQAALGSNNPGAWKLEYQDLINAAVGLAPNTPEPILKNGFALFKQLGEFKKYALKIVTEIVEELVFPMSSRKHKPIVIVPSSGTQDPNIPSRLVYTYDHFIVTLSISEEVVRPQLKDFGLDQLVIEESSVGCSSPRKKNQSSSS